MKHLANPFEIDGKWYRANLHSHTNLSDGRLSPAQRVDQYQHAGYDVLALTDHNCTQDVRAFNNGRMLVLGGIEFHPSRPRDYHLVGLNVPANLRFRDPEDANECIIDVRHAGGAVVLAHPFWMGQQFSQFHELRGLAALEVYNVTCDYCGRACSENEWAHALSGGMVLPCVGVDDAHGGTEGHDSFGAWTWLKMDALTPSAVTHAISHGACYATCGPKVHDFRVQSGKVHLRCSPAAKIQFLCGPGQGATRRVQPGHTIATLTIDHPNWPFVRAIVTDAAGRKAWTNPIAL